MNYEKTDTYLRDLMVTLKQFGNISSKWAPFFKKQLIAEAFHYAPSSQTWPAVPSFTLQELSGCPKGPGWELLFFWLCPQDLVSSQDSLTWECRHPIRERYL